MELLRVGGWFSLIVLSAAQNMTHSRGPPPPSYLLLAPSVLRPGVPPSLSVTILSSSSVTVKANIVHHTQPVASISATVKGGSTKLLTFPPIHGNESSLPFSLNVSGYVGSVQVFSNVTELHFDPKDHSTFIQTDQQKYRPGQVVKIRAVSVRPNGKPYSRPLDVTVSDPRGNLLRQWLAANADLGVVSREFELSENPPLGDWTIVATSNNVSSSKRFTVAHSVTPACEVLINAPAVVYVADTLSGSVTARYSYRKPVQGSMSIRFRLHSWSSVEVYEEHREIDGTAGFSFRDADYSFLEESVELFTDLQDEFVTIEVNVTEDVTGFTCSSNTKVFVAKHLYKLSFEDFPQVLRPNLNFTARLKLSTYNNQPLSLDDQQKTVQVSVMQQKLSVSTWAGNQNQALFSPNVSGLSWSPPDEPRPLELWFQVPADGVIPLSIFVQDGTGILIIDAAFEDSQNTLQVQRTYTSPGDFYLQIQKPATAAQIGSPFRLHVERNFPNAVLHYIVKSGGQVVSAGKSTDDVRLVPEASWSPLASVLVYTVTSSQEVVNDAIELPIAPPFQNQVSLRWSTPSRRPGDDVTLSITVAEPGSLVGILVVDTLTQWMGSNDITEEKVLEGLKDPAGHTQGRSDPYAIFESCGLLVLTDASLHRVVSDLSPVPLTSDLRPAAEVRERWNFPETWLWMEVKTGGSKRAQVTVTVPDTVGRAVWTASAFVVSENLGLGFADRPAQLTVFRDLFLALNLPAYVIRGEVLLLEVVLFHKLPLNLEVTVTVEHSNAFELDFSEVERPAVPGTRRVSVESGRQRSVLFPIKPLVLGETLLSVEAASSMGSELVRRTLLVKAEGLEQSFSSSMLLELSSSQPSLSRDVAFSFPADVVEGSSRVSVTAVGDILGPSIHGLDSLIQLPHGCGEQNMINFAPNIYILQYLSATGQLDADIRTRAIDYMMKGYERELSYQRADGSFSAFGEQDASGSTWLTAFVLRCFLQARPFVGVDARVLQRAAAWLASRQGSDGRFEEPGRVIHTELQGGQDGPIALTAYVLIALLEDSDIRAQYRSQVSSGLLFLETRLALGVSGNYSLSLLTYALALHGSANANAALGTLLGRAEPAAEADAVPVWRFPERGLSPSWQPRSAHIEMVSYVLLSEHRLGRILDGIALMKWLSQQRNHMGGFGSTQDTVTALQALSTLAALGQSNSLNVSLTVNADASTTVASFHIQPDNYLLPQSQELVPAQELQLQMKASGHGFAVCQLNVFYNIRDETLMRRKREATAGEAFDLDVQLEDAELSSGRLLVCYSLSEAVGLSATGMAVLEVGLQSGFSLAPSGVRAGGGVKRVEAPPGRVIVYLDSVTTKEACVTVPLFLEFKVARVQEAAVVLYDYYEPRRRTVRTYESYWRRYASVCFFCGERCSDCREDDDGFYPASHAVRTLSPSALVAALLIAAFSA
ncbi:CD109 antigen isoform X2 [Betta splendens]|uniref:CD109 antigen isoform X2 n=1 Tax=Betta splendens TaxID=158456 RepID=A0A8M1HAV7_BETSP|nr:CD109 antigen isoform X2 [Betta splendens]